MKVQMISCVVYEKQNFTKRRRTLWEKIFYLKDLKNFQSIYKRFEIHAALEKYGFTPGKISGIIYRAAKQKYLRQVQRGKYEFGKPIEQEQNSENEILSLACREIQNTIENIKKIMIDNLTEMSPKEFEEIKNKLEALSKILE